MFWGKTYLEMCVLSLHVKVYAEKFRSVRKQDGADLEVDTRKQFGQKTDVRVHSLIEC